MAELAREIAAAMEEKSYTYWCAQSFPQVFEREVDGQEIQVEVEHLEQNRDYIHLNVAVDDGRLSAFSPACYGAIIHRTAVEPEHGPRERTGLECAGSCAACVFAAAGVAAVAVWILSRWLLR